MSWTCMLLSMLLFTISKFWIQGLQHEGSCMSRAAPALGAPQTRKHKGYPNRHSAQLDLYVLSMAACPAWVRACALHQSRVGGSSFGCQLALMACMSVAGELHLWPHACVAWVICLIPDMPGTVPQACMERSHATASRCMVMWFSNGRRPCCSGMILTSWQIPQSGMQPVASPHLPTLSLGGIQPALLFSS